jgi:hypothetical protein
MWRNSEEDYGYCSALQECQMHRMQKEGNGRKEQKAQGVL